MRSTIAAILLIFIFTLVGVLTLSHYGMHEDNPFHFLRGQYFLERLLGGSGQFAIPPTTSPVLFVPGQRISAYKPNAAEQLFSPLRPIPQTANESLQKTHARLIQTLGHRLSLYKHNAWTASIWELVNNQGHPAISDMLMAATNRVTYELLGILPDVEGYQVYTLVVLAISLVLLYLFVADAFGPFPALIAVVSLALYPMVFGESHFNIKDPVQMGYFTMAVVSWYFTLTKRLHLDWLVLCILAVLGALGTKWNIVFAPFILLPWTISVWRNLRAAGTITSRRLLLYGGVAAIVPFLLLIITYPSFWDHTIDKLLETFNYYLSLSVKDLRIENPSPLLLPGGFDGRALLFFLSMSPPLMLVLAGIGGIGAIVGKISGKYKAGMLVLLWFIVPFLRVIWQTSETYGSIRHFMEFLPAFCVFVGLGSAWSVTIISRVTKRVRISVLQAVFLGMFIVIQSLILVRLHPYEHLYFNSFIGGARGAQSIGLYTWETIYDAPYRQLAYWLNAHAQNGTQLAHLDGTMMAISPLWLRQDIRIGTYFSGFEQKGEYIASIVYDKPPAVFPYNYLAQFIQPVFEVKVDGVVIGKVWKNDPAHSLVPADLQIFESDALSIQPSTFQGADQVETVLPGALRILKVKVSASDIRCITQRNLVWSIARGSDETYMVPWVSDVTDTTAVLSFPGVRGDRIRIWDIEHAGCGNLLHIDRVEGAQ